MPMPIASTATPYERAAYALADARDRWPYATMWALSRIALRIITDERFKSLCIIGMDPRNPRMDRVRKVRVELCDRIVDEDPDIVLPEFNDVATSLNTLRALMPVSDLRTTISLDAYADTGTVITLRPEELTRAGISISDLRTALIQRVDDIVDASKVICDGNYLRSRGVVRF